jgi:hypothetical protein
LTGHVYIMGKAGGANQGAHGVFPECLQKTNLCPRMLNQKGGTHSTIRPPND